MSDNRPWAKIDTSYMMNPKWFQVERAIGKSAVFANGKNGGTCHELAIANALRTARECHLASILYCAQNQTDGVFPVRAIKAIVSVTTEAEEAALTALFEVGMWVNMPGGMAEIHDFLEHQTSAALTRKRRDAGRKGAERRWQNDGKPNAVANGKPNTVANGKTMASANAEEKRREEIYTPSIEGVGDSADAPAPSKRGTRLPDTFTITADMLTWAATHAPGVDVEIASAKFVDYWRAQPGQRGVKVDWIATWRNWLRRESEDAIRRGGYRTQDQIMRDMQAKAAARTAAMGSALNLIEGGKQ